MGIIRFLGMYGQFELIFSYRRQQHHYVVIRQEWGDTHRYAMNINDIGILFEPGVHGGYQAVIVPGQNNSEKKIQEGLLDHIAKELQKRTGKLSSANSK